jgi:hypothetical protein
MTFKSRFTPSEWDSLTSLPFRMLILVATFMRAGQADPQELLSTSLERFFGKTNSYPDPLHRELAMDLVRADNEAAAMNRVLRVMQRAMNFDNLTEDLTKIRTLLRAKLTQGEYDSFVASLCLEVMTEAFEAIRSVTGDDRRSKKRRAKVIDGETKALNFTVNFWGIDPSVLAQLSSSH